MARDSPAPGTNLVRDRPFAGGDRGGMLDHFLRALARDDDDPVPLKNRIGR
jgi:hypothetical protein